MAVQTVMLIAAYFGEQEVSWGSMSEKQTGLIISIMIIQLIAIVGAILTARFSEKFGNIQVLIALNFMWVSLCLYAFFVRTPIEFYIAAGFVGLSMGGIQSWPVQHIPNIYQKLMILHHFLVFTALHR